MKSSAATVDEYLASLPEDRRETISIVRDAINARLPEGLEEGIQYGGIGWFVPHSIFPPGYHCDPKQPLPFAGITNAKNHISLHLFFLYADEARLTIFKDQFAAAGKKLDMGKACVRLKKLENFSLAAVVDAVASISLDGYVAHYCRSFSPKDEPAKKTK